MTPLNRYRIRFSNLRVPEDRRILQTVVIKGSEPLVAWLRFEALYPKKRFIPRFFGHA